MGTKNIKDLIIKPWEIKSLNSTEDTREFRESIFSQGSGFMGVRGFRPDEKGRHDAWRSTFFAGFFEYIRPGITDMVNQPDFSSSKIIINGVSSDELLIKEFSQTLNMKDGRVIWKYLLEDNDGKQTAVEIERFLSMAVVQTAGIRFKIKPLNHSVVVVLSTGIDGNVKNLPISDNQLHANIEMLKIWDEPYTKFNENVGTLTTKTAFSGRKTSMAFRVESNGDIPIKETQSTQNGYIGVLLKAKLDKEEEWQVDKIISVASFRDSDDPEQSVNDILSCCESYDRMLVKTTKAWVKIWENSDIQIDGDESWQGAIRYNIFQLVQTAPKNDEFASIGARGLMHGRYKGCYFWDTEIFMLPFFIDTQPETARNLLMYRYNTLDDAVMSAKNFSAKGARYSWMSSDTGFEQCETWDTGCCEIHITADIAYAVGRYYKQTNDEKFLVDFGAKILFQTARYWTDRFTYNKAEDRYHLLFVKGPDEYCGVTSNDFYTVKMAAHNLELALDTAELLKGKYPVKWEKIKGEIELADDEMGIWADIIKKKITVFDEKRNLWIQDATFEYMEPLDVETQKDDNIPIYHKINYDRLQRYKVLKQPAVLMYMALFPDEFSKEEIRSSWEYYTPKTLHDSTLSYGIHALVAARLGLKDQATKFFEKSLFLDLKDVMNNVATEGIHTAALGATWQSLIYGFAGYTTTDNSLEFNSALPAKINSMNFVVNYRDKRYRVSIVKGKKTQIKLTPN